MDAEADLSLRWTHMSVCWFCHEATHIYLLEPLGRAGVLMNFWPLALILTGLRLQTIYCFNTFKLAASSQNQQNDCAPSEDSDQPGAWASAQSDQSLRCPNEESFGP